MGSTLWYFKKDDQKGEGYTLYPRKGSTVAVKYVKEKLENYFHQKKYKKIFPEYKEGIHEVGLKDERLFLQYKDMEADPRAEKPEEVLGVFRFHMLDYSYPHLQRVPLSTDEYIPMTMDTDLLVNDIQKFFCSREKYEALGLKYRRGSLVHGPPGNGKTFSITRAVQDLADQEKVVVLFMDRGLDLEDLFKFRYSFGDYPVILIFEEVTEYLENELGSFLSFLDGEFSWNNCYSIATTNYPDKLPASVVDRPGRFDTVIKVDAPSKEARRTYLQKHFSEEEVTDKLISETKDCSIAYLKEVVVRSKLFDKDPLEIVKQLNDYRRLVNDNFTSGGRGSNYL